ncbi:MAG: hypothetical protein GX595_06485, partial [Lentisphaerae bacterium]|nr:hypothetical protein [Lentisphaerota bacterium]
MTIRHDSPRSCGRSRRARRLFSALAIAAAAAAAEPSLELPLAGPQDLRAGEQAVRLEGTFATVAEGVQALAIGQDVGPSLPAAPWFAPAGTLAFTLRYHEPDAANRLHNRHLVTLRLEGRGFLGFYFIQNDWRLQVAYKQLPESIRMVTPEPLRPGQDYRAAVTWDGKAVCFYLDGQRVGEMPQGFPATYPPYAKLNLGPYKDGWVTARPWGANDVFLRDLKVWREALDPAAIAADAGVEAGTALGRYPTTLSVPRLAAAPAVDGRLDDPAWQGAASVVSLLDQGRPEASLSYPGNRPLLAHDGEALYVGFETLFPTGARLLPGQKREGAEPEVWTDESFEFYLDVDGRRYRFAGNPAGGWCESRDGDASFDGPWQYASNLSFRIDGRWHWQGELRIPFASLGLTTPVAERDLRINFCRTWRCLDAIGLTSLQTATMNYGKPEHFVTIRLAGDADAVSTADSSDPSFGHFAQAVTVNSERGGEYTWTVRALNSAGDGDVLVQRAARLEPGGRTTLAIETAITAAGARNLCFQLHGPGGAVLLQQVVPFRLSADYLDVTPRFGAGELILRPRWSLLQAQTGAVAPAVRLLGPDGQERLRQALTGDEAFRVPFPRDWPTGAYVAEVVSGQGDAVAVHTAKRFTWTGPGPWEDLAEVPDVVPPPFTPLECGSEGARLDLAAWGRQTRFDGSLLPVAMQSQGHDLLSAPAALLIDGVAVAGGAPVVQRRTPVRVEFSNAVAGDGWAVRQESWAEYDGVVFTRLRIQASRDLGAVSLRLALPAAAARFAHVTASGFGGGSRRNLWLDRDHELPFYPSVWIGNHERGLAWFAESSASWRTRLPRPLRLRRDGDSTALEVTFADSLAAGTELDLEFGLLATPVRPLPPQYPLNLFASDHGVHLNRPAPRLPTIAWGLSSWEGTGFFDLPLDQAEPTSWKWLLEHHRRGEENRAGFTPYTAAMFIPEEYPEAASRIAEWGIVPANHLTYERDGVTRDWYWTCAASDAGKFFAWKFDRLLDRVPLRGIYLDFGAAFRCGNALHGCHDRYPILAQRRLYQRLAGAFARHGVSDYAIVVHNSECVQWPTFTHVTHFFNGEGLRQMSSPTFHDGKDLQDTYSLLDFAMEHSSLPFGITS